MVDHSPPENEAHDELVLSIESGYSAVLEELKNSSGLLQTVAIVRGGGREFSIVAWHQDATGNWRSKACITIPASALAEMSKLIHSSGNSTPLKSV